MHPSGKQHEIVHGDLRAVIVEVGGGLRTLYAGDFEVIDGYDVDAMCHDARGHLLIPWPNRLDGGRYRFEGQEYQLPLTEPTHGNAIHGLVGWLPWRAEEAAESSVTMTCRLFPSPGYPFTLDLSSRYALDRDGLAVTLRARNAGDVPCPFGAGQHPYVRCRRPLIDGCVLRIPARTIYRYDDRLIPVERVPVEGTPLDFRTARPIEGTVINMDYTDLERDANGIARVSLHSADGGVAVEVWMDKVFKHATVYTGETVQPPSRRRKSLAVEPMTCPPNAFRSGEDLVVLKPGEEWSGTWGIKTARAKAT